MMGWDPAPPVEVAFPKPRRLLTHQCDVCGLKTPAPTDPKRPWCSADTDVCDGRLLPIEEPK